MKPKYRKQHPNAMPLDSVNISMVNATKYPTAAAIHQRRLPVLAMRSESVPETSKMIAPIRNNQLIMRSSSLFYLQPVSLTQS